MSSPYRYSSEPTGTHAIILSEVLPQSKVLDIGCAAGYLGSYLLTEKQCEVWGVEPNTESAREAEQKYKKVLCDSVEGVFNGQSLEGELFDVIILGDVLEHLLAPEEMLRKIARFLKPSGRIIISLPNVAHYSIRRTLVLGNWDMQDSGILDRTHLHFFTLKTARMLIEKTGLYILKYYPRGDLERWMRKIGLGFIGRSLTKVFPGFFAIQHIFVVEKRKENT